MTLLDLLVLTLAAGAVVDVWFNGSIFESARSYVSLRALGPEPDTEPPTDSEGEPPAEEPATGFARFADRVVPDWLCQLLDCPFCLSYHAPWVLALLFLVTGSCLGVPWEFLLKVPLYSLAATRLGNLIESVLPVDSRYNRSENP